VAKKDPQFLYQGIQDTIKQGPVRFKFNAQVAENGDVTDDATVHWPESRKIVTLGTITLNSVVEDTLGEQKKIIFDPIPRVNGVEPSDDPLLDVRATLYLISGRERRAA
jgi:catalase